MLAGGYKNLEYLKSYGFKTFSNCWSENYDNIFDPKDRIDSIFESIRSINLYPVVKKEIQEKLELISQAHDIAIENRSYFWSDKFYNRLLTEAVENLTKAKIELATKRV